MDTLFVLLMSVLGAAGIALMFFASGVYHGAQTATAKMIQEFKPKIEAEISGPIKEVIRKAVLDTINEINEEIRRGVVGGQK